MSFRFLLTFRHKKPHFGTAWGCNPRPEFGENPPGYGCRRHWDGPNWVDDNSIGKACWRGGSCDRSAWHRLEFAQESGATDLCLADGNEHSQISGNPGTGLGCVFEAADDGAVELQFRLPARCGYHIGRDPIKR